MAIPEGGPDRGDVPVPDLLEQQEPADPDAGEEELPEFDAEFHPEADPADILEQHRPLPGDDDYPHTKEDEP